MPATAFSSLLRAYRDAPGIYQATSYWDRYEKPILEALENLEPDELRSGKYPILSTFGFSDLVYAYPPTMPKWKKTLQRAFHGLIGDRAILPYGLKLSDLREMAVRHCRLVGELANAVPIHAIEMSSFGGPTDLFESRGKRYSMQFLSYYPRYCFAHEHLQFRGDEVIVELGSGSGHQVEMLKKLYPGMTILCFDLPASLFLCELYLSQALGGEVVVGTERTSSWTDLSRLERGKVHFFGNWQFPVLRDFAFDVFWNAASFGEMEPHVVEHYLEIVLGNAAAIYLLQARHGKETVGTAHVERQTTFADYDRFVAGYELMAERMRTRRTAASRTREGTFKQCGRSRD